MSNIFDSKNPYFQIPQRVRKYRSKDWTLAEKLLHEYLLSEAQRTNMIVLVRSNAQIREAAFEVRLGRLAIAVAVVPCFLFPFFHAGLSS